MPKQDEGKKAAKPDSKMKMTGFYLTLTFAVFAVVGLWLGVNDWVWNYDETKVLGTNEYGDSFGSLNTIFSGIGMAFIAATLFLTTRQVRLQQREMRDTNRLLDLQREEMDRQNMHLEEEAIRNRFFKMLDSWQDMVQSTEWSRYKHGDGIVYRGREAYVKVEGRLKQHGATYTAATTPREYIGEVVETAVNSYDIFYKEYLWMLPQYLRLFYHCLKFVHKSNLEDAEKYELMSILRAHLSQSELRIIMLNGLTDRGKKMYQYIEAYDLLQNYDPRNTLNRRLFLAYPRRFKQLRQEDGVVQDIMPTEIIGPRLPVYAHELDAEFMPDENEDIPTLA